MAYILQEHEIRCDCCGDQYLPDECPEVCDNCGHEFPTYTTTYRLGAVRTKRTYTVEEYITWVLYK